MTLELIDNSNLTESLQLIIIRAMIHVIKRKGGRRVETNRILYEKEGIRKRLTAMMPKTTTTYVNGK